MHSFKTGDEVRCLRDLTHCCGPAVGEVKTITSISPNGNYIRFDGLAGGHYPKDFEPVRPGAPLAVSSKPRPKAPIKPGSRHEQVLNHLLTGKTLTQGEGIVLGYGTRVAATVHDLRRRGHTITTTMKEDLHGSPYAEYRLVTRRANGNRKAA